MPSVSVKISVRVNKEKLDRLITELKPRADAILDKSAFDIQASAQGYALIDTGAMRASIYTKGPGGGGSGYGAALEAARKQGASTRGQHSGRYNLNIQGADIPDVEEMQRVIGCAVSYGVYVELRYKPFMAPAAEDNRKSFIEAWKSLV